MQTEDGRDLEQLLWERLGTVIDPGMRLSGRAISVVDLGPINGPRSYSRSQIAIAGEPRGPPWRPVN